MNYKNLNYEIETARVKEQAFQDVEAMNYKNLNYEIETHRPETYWCRGHNYEL